MKAKKKDTTKFQNYPLQLSDFQSPDLIEKQISQQNNYGSYNMQSWTLQGIRIRHIENQCHDNYTFERENNENLVALSFNLKGNFSIQQAGRTYHTAPNQHNIIFTNGVGSTFQNKELKSSSFAIDFTPEAFLEIISISNPLLQAFAKLMQTDQALVLSPQSIVMDHHLAKAIKDILQCPYTGGLKQLFLLSKVIEILVLQGEAHYFAHDPSPKQSQKTKDLEKIFYARQYLFEHMDHPPSLRELSKIVGLNEYKLKKEYKAIFKTTLFAHLTAFRLELAKEKLLNTQQGVSEMAFELGYSSPQHFSNAFKKQFGKSPRAFRKEA